MHNSFRFISTGLTVMALAGLVACAAPVSRAPVASYPQQVYPAVQPAQTVNAELGRITRVDVLHGAEQSRGSGVGAILGGVVGAIVGHQIGGGFGNDVATVAGAVGGGFAGNAIEKNRSAATRESYRLSIQMDSGALRAYDVPAHGNLRAGDRVRVDNGQISRI